MSRSQRDLRTVGNRCCLRHPFYGAFVRETQTKTICNHAACHNRQVCVFLSVAMPAISLTGLTAPAAAPHATLSSTWEPASLPHREKALTLSRPAFPLWRSEWNTVCAMCVFVDALPQVDKVPLSSYFSKNFHHERVSNFVKVHLHIDYMIMNFFPL